MISTHSGCFFTSDIFAIALIKKLHKYKNYKIIRTDDPKKIKESEIKIEVGGKYDPKNNYFDINDPKFDEKFAENYSMKMHSCGIVWKQIGFQLINQFYGKKIENNIKKDIYSGIYRKFFYLIDLCDQKTEFYTLLNDKNRKLKPHYHLNLLRLPKNITNENEIQIYFNNSLIFADKMINQIFEIFQKNTFPIEDNIGDLISFSILKHFNNSLDDKSYKSILNNELSFLPTCEIIGIVKYRHNFKTILWNYFNQLFKEFYPNFQIDNSHLEILFVDFYLKYGSFISSIDNNYDIYTKDKEVIDFKYIFYFLCLKIDLDLDLESIIESIKISFLDKFKKVMDDVILTYHSTLNSTLFKIPNSNYFYFSFNSDRILLRLIRKNDYSLVENKISTKNCLSVLYIQNHKFIVKAFGNKYFKSSKEPIEIKEFKNYNNAIEFLTNLDNYIL